LVCIRGEYCCADQASVGFEAFLLLHSCSIISLIIFVFSHDGSTLPRALGIFLLPSGQAGQFRLITDNPYCDRAAELAAESWGLRSPNFQQRRFMDIALLALLGP
jgi:hypothetical protein